MCRNIRPLNNFAPPATTDEVRAAALQYVRKVSGTTKPSAANQEAFDRAVEEVAPRDRHLLDALVTTAPPKTARSRRPRRAPGRRSATDGPAEAVPHVRTAPGTAHPTATRRGLTGDRDGCYRAVMRPDGPRV
jgi:hypothetical protein